MRHFSSYRNLALVLAALLTPMRAHADEVGPQTNAVALTATPGSTGLLEIDFLNNNGGVIPVTFDVSAYSFTLTATPVATASGLSFTGITFAPNYIFPSSTAQSGGSLSSTSFPSLSVNAADTDTATAGFTEVDSGQSYGLATVAFAVSANATPGVYALTFPAFTVTETSNSPVTVTLAGASTITIVPEPGSLVWCGLAAAGALAGCARARRRRA